MSFTDESLDCHVCIEINTVLNYDLWSPRMQCTASSPHESSQMGGDRAELTQLPAKDSSSIDSASELGSPRALTFDLLNMVICFKRMAIFLEPVTDTLEVLRYLLGWETALKNHTDSCTCTSNDCIMWLLWEGFSFCSTQLLNTSLHYLCCCVSQYSALCVFRWRMPLCSLLSCVLLNILFLTLSEGETGVDKHKLCVHVHKYSHTGTVMA